MKFFSLIKSIPFISTLIIIILLNFNNQKEYTKLKILIWNTPTLSLGTYLAISTGTGYILSYIVTSTLVKNNNKTINEPIKYKLNKEDNDLSLNAPPINEQTYNNTLIERDIKDPSPTINANFRIIGNTNRKNQTLDNNQKQDEFISDSFDQSDHEYYDQEFKYKNENNVNSILNDWEDDTYLKW